MKDEPSQPEGEDFLPQAAEGRACKTSGGPQTPSASCPGHDQLAQPIPPAQGSPAFPDLVSGSPPWQPAEHALWCSAAHKEVILGNAAFWHD